MPFVWWVELTGVVVATVGGVLGLAGFLKTFWKYNAKERFLDPVANRVAGLARILKNKAMEAVAWAGHRLRRPFGRSQPPVLKASADAVASVDLAMVRAAINTEVDRPLAEVVGELQEQTQRLVADRFDAVTKRVDRLDDVTNDVAAGGIRIQFLGLLLVTTGTLMTGLPPAIQELTRDHHQQMTCHRSASTQSGSGSITLICDAP